MYIENGNTNYRLSKKLYIFMYEQFLLVMLKHQKSKRTTLWSAGMAALFEKSNFLTAITCIHSSNTTYISS